jgi:predicted enzyme related to lactoylglutathione lyase
VTFVQDPVDMPFGRWALLEDGQGNRFPMTVR